MSRVLEATHRQPPVTHTCTHTIVDIIVDVGIDNGIGNDDNTDIATANLGAPSYGRESCAVLRAADLVFSLQCCRSGLQVPAAGNRRRR